MEPIQSNKIYPIGIQNFEKMRKGGYFYVDKTALVYRLVKTGSYYFLSRPGASARACSSPPSKPTSRERRNSLKGWRWRSWRKTG